MKLVSFSVASPMGPQTRIGALAPAGIVDLAAAYHARLLAEGLTAAAAQRIAEAVLPPDMVAFIEGGSQSLGAARRALEWVEQSSDTTTVQSSESVKLLPPLPRPPLLRDFMAFETHLLNIYPKLGREIPPEWYKLPVYYKGNTGSLSTDGDDVSMPSYADDLDFEFEFAAVIGRGGRNIPRAEALSHIFGYTLYNDFSARDIQSREMSVGLGPAKGKDFSGGHVLGPWLVTADEIPDIYNLRMVARVNGQLHCESNSGTMHWKFEDMIAHASLDEMLVPGEIFGSGTVGGGSGKEADISLGRGDVVELEMDILGILTNRIV